MQVIAWFLSHMRGVCFIDQRKERGMRDSAGLVEQSALLKASEHSVPLPESLDEEFPENSNQQNKSHTKRKFWEALEYVRKGMGLKPRLPSPLLVSPGP